MLTKHKLEEGASISTTREPQSGGAESRPHQKRHPRGFQPPDASMPGPLARLYPVDDDLESSAGGDSFYDGAENQKQDRI